VGGDRGWDPSLWHENFHELDDVLFWFRNECRKNISFIEHRKSLNRELPHNLPQEKQVDAQMSLSDCWELFQKFVE
jgi:hypothetical protein